MNVRILCGHCVVTAASAVVLVSLAGCYTILTHPQAPDPTAYDVEAVDPYGSPYRYVPSPTVVGWYEHYGPYWYYYVDPWWSSGYYPPVTGDSPPPKAPGFDRGGRLRSEPVRTDSPGQPTRTVQSPPPDDKQDAEDEKAKEEKKKATIGGRGGRK